MISRLIQLAKGLLALSGIAAITIAVPLLLLRQGIPFAEAVDAFGDELTSDSTRIETVLSGGLTALGWAAWAMIMAALVNEVVAQIRGRMPTRLPVAPGMQMLSQHLVGAVVLAVSVFGSASSVGAGTPAPPQPLVAFDQAPADPTPSTITPAAPDHGAHDDAGGQPARGQETRTHRVVAGDTLWDLSETLLGDATRWREIVDLNTGTTMSDGTTFSRNILPGWDLQIPAESEPSAEHGEISRSAVVHEVERGDTLWEISEDYLGEGQRYTEIAADNPEIADPDLIFPGQQFTINDVVEVPAVVPSEPPPAPPAEASTTVLDPELERETANDQPPNMDAGAPAEEENTGADQQSPDAPADVDDEAVVVPSVPAQDVPAAPGTPGADPLVGEEQRTADVGEAGTAFPIPAGLAAAGLVTAGMVGVVERRRRGQRKDRKRGQTAPAADPEVQAAEMALRRGANVDRATYLAVALRALANKSPAAGLPPIRWVSVDEQSVSIQLHDGGYRPPPEGWEGEADANRWVTSLRFPRLVQMAGDVLDPLPLLCPVGVCDDGSEVLVDLEQAGIVTIDGDPGRQAGLLRAMAMNAAASPWASSPRVVLAGFAGPVCELPNVQVIELAASGIEQAVGHAERVQESLADIGCESIVQARMSGAQPDAWEPMVVLSSQPTGETHFRAARGVLPEKSLGAAVVSVSEHACSEGLAVTVTADGQLIGAGLPESLTASFLDDGDVRLVTQILDHASTTATVPIDDEASPRREAPPIPPETNPAEIVSALVSDVDVFIRVLGAVEVEDVRNNHPVTFPRDRAMEATVLLATGTVDRRIGRESLESKLWPTGQNARKNVSNAISEARSSLGTCRDGADLLLPPRQDVYELSERVSSDWELFETLHQMADGDSEYTPSYYAALLAEAMKLVRDTPFSGKGLGWAWVDQHRNLAINKIVDVAHAAASAYLDLDDVAAAERMCLAGLRVSPTEECLYQLRMVASAQGGSRAGVTRVFRELESALEDPEFGTEPESGISQDTRDLYGRLMTGATTAAI